MFKGKEVTIYDLADRLNLSIATVSRALKDDPVVSRKTKRKIINNIRAHMRFEDGKIIEHSDQFKLSSWCRQALGWPGALFGRMNWFQRKIRRSAQQNLYDYIVAQRGSK